MKQILAIIYMLQAMSASAQVKVVGRVIDPQGKPVRLWLSPAVTRLVCMLWS